MAGFVVEHGSIGAALLDRFRGDLGEVREAMTERHPGIDVHRADFIQELTEKAVAIPHRVADPSNHTGRFRFIFQDR